MIEMDEQFQQQFGDAMAQLRAAHRSLVGTAENSRGEARKLTAGHRPTEAITSYEHSQAFWTAAERLRPVLAAFEDADRRGAELMAMPAPEEPRELRALRERTRYLEDQLARLDTALRGRPATLDEQIRETDTTEDLIDAAVRLIEDRPERERADREHERAQNLAKVTQEAAKLLGVTTLPESLTALQRLVFGGPLNLDTLANGTLIAGQWIGSDLPARRWYLGRFERKLTNPDGAVVERICTACDGFKDTAHVVHTQLAAGSLRLPTADEIIEFSQLTKTTGLLRLPDESDE